MRIFKKSQSFIALFIIFLSIFIYGIYFWDSWKEVSKENENYKNEGKIIENLLTLKEGKCIPINSYLEVNVYSFYNKGVIELGPFRYNIRNLKPYFLSDWKNEPVSYRRVNTTYYFSYLKNNNVYLQIVYPFTLEPTSKKGVINLICLQNHKIIIQ